VDHQAAVLGNALQKVSDARSVDKRYRVTVEFAHGVRHVLQMSEPDMERFVDWARGDGPALMTYRDSDIRWYCLNRDYLCALVVEEIPSECDESRR
jgi:hypothetical protein